MKTVVREHFLCCAHDLVAPPRLVFFADRPPSAGAPDLVSLVHYPLEKFYGIDEFGDHIQYHVLAGWTLFIEPTTWPTK